MRARVQCCVRCLVGDRMKQHGNSLANVTVLCWLSSIKSANEGRGCDFLGPCRRPTARKTLLAEDTLQWLTAVKGGSREDHFYSKNFGLASKCGSKQMYSWFSSNGMFVVMFLPLVLPLHLFRAERSFDGSQSPINHMRFGPWLGTVEQGASGRGCCRRQLDPGWLLSSTLVRGCQLDADRVSLGRRASFADDKHCPVRFFNGILSVSTAGNSPKSSK
jgi:hypothetical protein